MLEGGRLAANCQNAENDPRKLKKISERSFMTLCYDTLLGLQVTSSTTGKRLIRTWLKLTSMQYDSTLCADRITILFQFPRKLQQLDRNFVVNAVIYTYTANFINACLTSECKLVECLVYRSITFERMRSPVGRNALW